VYARSIVCILGIHNIDNAQELLQQIMKKWATNACTMKNDCHHKFVQTVAHFVGYHGNGGQAETVLNGSTPLASGSRHKTIFQ